MFYNLIQVFIYFISCIIRNSLKNKIAFNLTKAQ